SSACAVGSPRWTISLCASARISPSRTMIAPTGTSSRTEAASARRRAPSMPARSPGEGWPLRTHRLRQARTTRESQSVTLTLDPNNVTRTILALQDLERNRILQQPLNGALEGPGSENRIVSLLRQELPRLRRDLETQVARGDQLLQVSQLKLNDAKDVLPAQLVEDDHVVDSIQELGPEIVAQLVPYPLLEALPRAFGGQGAGIHDE